MLKISQIDIKKRGKKSLVKVTYNEKEANKEGNDFDTVKTKQSNQYLSRDLDNAISRLKPHLGFASEMADSSIKLNDEMDYEKWWDEHEYLDDERFAYLEITKIQFVGTEALDAVKIFGYRATQLTDKEFKVKFETPVVNLDRVAENRYALVHLLSDHCEDLLVEIDAWLSKGKTLSKSQQAELFDKANAEAAEK